MNQKWLAGAVRRLSRMAWLVPISFPALAAAQEMDRSREVRPTLVVQAGASAYAADISSDARWMVTGDGIGVATLWDVRTGAELRRFIGHKDGVTDVAFSEDDMQIFTASGDGSVRLWDSATGAELRRFDGHTKGVTDLAISPDGQQLLTASTDHTARLWDVATGVELRRLSGHRFGTSVAFFPDGDRLLTAGWNTARIWDAHTGREIGRLEIGRSDMGNAAISPGGELIATGRSGGGAILWDARTGAKLREFGELVPGVAFSPDGLTLLGGASDATAYLWDVTSGAELKRFEHLQPRAPGGVTAHFGEVGFSAAGDLVFTARGDARVWHAQRGAELVRFDGRIARARDVNFSPDDRQLAVSAALFGGDNAAVLWDLKVGKPLTALTGHRSYINDLAFSPDGERLLTAAGDVWRDNTARIWDVATGTELTRFGASPRFDITSAAWSPGGRLALIGTSDGNAHLWDPTSGRELRRFTVSGAVNSVKFTGGGERVLTGGFDSAVRLWDSVTGAELDRLDAGIGVYSIDVSRDGRVLVGGSGDNALRLWQPAGGDTIMRLEGHSDWVRDVTFTPDGEHALSASDDNTARLWDLATGQQLLRLIGHTSDVIAADVSSDGQLFATASDDGTARLWRGSDGAEIARLIWFRDGNWAVVAPDGRFDTGELERVSGVHWVAADDPFTPISLEIFMRDYYEPRLLPRLLAGEELPEVGGLESRNRVQPRVRIVKVAPAADGLATITAEIQKDQRHFGRGTDSVLVRSGAADLRLFRDGQLVGYIDGALDASEDDVVRYTFDGIRLPRTGADSVTFSAYAFNENYTSSDGFEWIGRVKSATDYHTIAVPDAIEPRKGRAYLITIGVDEYESPAWNLRFAADDARVLGAELSTRLASGGAFADVVTIPLISDTDPARSTAATKAAIRGVIDLLAGRDVSAETRALIPNADRISAALPEDLVLISFSGHGYTDDGGIFYMLPADIGADAEKAVTHELLPRTVSSDELTSWLRDVDAGELVLIVDACHSAAAVEGEGFKPGPMGSRGLGQLAYDKGMRVLAASQAEDVALESDLLRQGLLTYALVQDGLRASQADNDPEDGVITLSEWLAYATERVPSLYQEVLEGEVQTFGRGFDVEGEGEDDPNFQRPALFDFRKGQRPVVLQGEVRSDAGLSP